MHMNIASFHFDKPFDHPPIQTSLIIETSSSKEVRIVLGQGQSMKEHKAPYPILIHMLQGSIDLVIAGEIHHMSAGDIIALDKQVPHHLTAHQDTIIRLTLSKADRLDRVEQVVDGQ